jgi:class 3 adenylate cyclase
VGDCVWATYNTPKTTDIDDVFLIAATANTLKQLLNCRLEKVGIDPIELGIGVDYGRVLMIQAGYSGSGINDVIYMGDVVNRAAHLAHKAGRGFLARPIWVGEDFQCNLNDHNKGLLTRHYESGTGAVFTGEVIHAAMRDWVVANC